MKIIVFETREDETGCIHSLAAALNLDVVITHVIPTKENTDLVEGCAGVSILGQGIFDKELLDLYHAKGVRYLSTRTIGYNHIDIAHAKSLGIRICNARYAPNGVADFTIMLMLMCLRHYKQALWRGQVNDFSLQGLQGKEMKGMIIGVIGTGNIGAQVILNLRGFGCRILAYDRYENDSVKSYASYVDLDTLYRLSDIITLHLPLTDKTRYMIHTETIQKMKDGVIIINCARGELADTNSLIEGIENEKIGALGMDTVEGEEGIIHKDHRIDILKNRDWFYLHQFRNVIMTQHMAFYTNAAVESMVKYGIQGIYDMKCGRLCQTEL